ncbi:MAG: siphovirus Gp157 family protein [Rhodospirillales bacterium]
MSTALTLYNIEEHLVALLDTAEMVETPEQQEAIFAEIQQALVSAVEKRDRVNQFIVHCESQQTAIDAEIKRLRALKDNYARAADRMQEYIVRTIQALGTDEKGRYRKLEGKTCVFGLRACPPSVEIRNEGEIPADYKTLTITVPAKVWEELTDNLDIEERSKFIGGVKKVECAIDKKAVKSAIDGGATVPGADLAIGKFSLMRK